MKVTINNKLHTIIYIEYNENVPHQVFTICEQGYSYGWDFLANNGNKKDVRFYHNGSGYNRGEKIPASRWVIGMEQRYWIGIGTRLKGRSNGIKIEKPLRVKGWGNASSINPFKVSEETHNKEYCEECGHESTEFCYKHKYEDSEGNERWIHNNEYSG